MDALAEDLTNDSKPTEQQHQQHQQESKGESQKPQAKFNTSQEAEYDFEKSNDVSMISAASSHSNSTQATNQPVLDLNKELEAKFNIEALRSEKEAEIQTFVTQLEAFKAEIAISQVRADNLAQ